MAQNEIAKLPEYDVIREHLEVERKTIIKVNSFDSDEYVRDIDDAKLILDFIERLQKDMWNFFNENQSLLMLFSKDYIPFSEFASREYVLDLVFLDECLFPEKEAFFFGQDGGINLNILQLHEKEFFNWRKEKVEAHVSTQDLILNNFHSELKTSELSCQCTSCNSTYRTRLREFIFDECKSDIEEAEKKLTENIDESLEAISDIYSDMQKSLDKRFHQSRFKLKRSTLNRLESQVKSILTRVFYYPSDLGNEQCSRLVPVYKAWLVDQDYSDDLVTDDEYGKFFRQLSSNIWRGERYLLKEFKKFVKSIVILKKKDVSSKILQEYLGEFWIHSQARTIKRKIVYHMGPTNSGKTYHAIQALCEAGTGCYLAPLRLLAGELYDTMNQKGVKTTLLTGEEVVEIDGATHYSSTIEMARFQEVFDCCVIDEIQMITDPQRGWAWTRALVNVFAQEVHLCGDPSALDLVKQIVELCGDELEIHNYNRMTELVVEKRPIVVGDLMKNDALIVFSRRNALRFKRDLEKIGFRVSIVYGRLSPEVRREQARKFDQGETDIMVSTDAIAMGMNLPIKRVVFSTLSKFFNQQEYPITNSEIKQIAGRAGRYQRFPTGYATCLSKVEDGPERIAEALSVTLDQSTKCMVGPDLDIFSQVNNALSDNNLPKLKLSEFLRLFNTMTFQNPFFCVELKEMIEIAEMVEEADYKENLTSAEIFGFACAPVNLGLLDHVQYFVWILNKYVSSEDIPNEEIDSKSSDIDYLETSIKCVELYQWLARHFDNKNFYFEEENLLENKGHAIEKLNTLLSQKIVPTCSSCGCKLSDDSKFAICEDCFAKRKFNRRPRGGKKGGYSKDAGAGKRKKTGNNDTRSGRGAFRKKKRKLSSGSKGKK